MSMTSCWKLEVLTEHSIIFPDTRAADFSLFGTRERLVEDNFYTNRGAGVVSG